MANASIVYTNLADAGTWTASTELALMPVSRLLGQHTSQRWRSTAQPATITVDLGSDKSLDTVGLFGMTIGTTATIQVLVSTSAGGAASGNLHNITYSAANAELAAEYGSLVLARAAPVSGRYVRFVITDSAATYIEAGRGVVGLRTTFTYNFAPGATRSYIDSSRKTKTSGGQTLVWRDKRYRSMEVNFEWVSEAQREGMIETIDRVNGQSLDVLFISDTASDKLPRDSIWGLITEPSAVLYTPIADIFSRQFRVEERL